MATKDHDTDPSTPSARRSGPPGRADTDPGVAPPSGRPGPGSEGRRVVVPAPGVAVGGSRASGDAVPDALQRKDSVELLLEGMSGPRPDRPKTTPQTGGEASAAYHAEHSLHAGHRAVGAEPKVLVERLVTPRAIPVAVRERGLAARAVTLRVAVRERGVGTGGAAVPVAPRERGVAARGAALPDAAGDPGVGERGAALTDPEPTFVTRRSLSSRVLVACLAGFGVVVALFFVFRWTTPPPTADSGLQPVRQRAPAEALPVGLVAPGAPSAPAVALGRAASVSASPEAALVASPAPATGGSGRKLPGPANIDPASAASVPPSSGAHPAPASTKKARARSPGVAPAAPDVGEFKTTF